MELVIEFTLPYLLPGLNGKHGLIRKNFHAAKKEKIGVWTDIMEQRPRAFRCIDYPVRIEYIRYSDRSMDWDNACASFKRIGDAMQEAKIISTDALSVLREFIPKQEMCKRSEKRTVVKVWKITQNNT